MKRILTAAVLIPLVLLAVFKAPGWLFTALVGGVALLALKEYLDLVEAYGVKPMRTMSSAIVGLIFLFVAWTQSPGFMTFGHFNSLQPIIVLVLLVFWPFLYLLAGLKATDLRQGFQGAVLSSFGLFYIGVSMLCLTFLREMNDGWYPVLFTFFAVWAGDTVAMYTGKAIGRHKMSPRVSPNKTWEGAVGSVLGSVFACWVLTYFAGTIQRVVYGTEGEISRFLSRVPLFVVIGSAVLINIAGQFGDLVESLIKRGADVKDSGALLPGHGGILDRIDALLFAAPVALVVFGLTS